jgi:hypothetical protein
MNDTNKIAAEARKAMSEPIHIISLGAGVQSSTMALMAAHGEITPMPKCAIFADTQDEPKSVYKWLDWLEKQLPFPVHRVSAGSLSDSATRLRVSGKSGKTYTETGIPAYTIDDARKKGMGMRQCTGKFKIEPIQKYLKSLSHQVTLWIGISRDEAHRMKVSRVSWITNTWPLVDRGITRRHCLRWMKDHGYEEPPRSACVYCPYHSDEQWRFMRDKEPLEFQRAVEFERRLQDASTKATALNSNPFLHASLVPLDQVDFSTDEDHGQQVMFGNECEGMCGV